MIKPTLIVILNIILTFGLFGQGHGKRGKTMYRSEIEKEQVVEGTWYLNQWTEFHTLTFDGYDLIADNNIDTIYRFQYQIAPDTLVLKDGWENIRHKNRIIKLTKDTLILDGIGQLIGRRTYTRTKIKTQH